MPGESPPAKKFHPDVEPSMSPSPVALPAPQNEEQLTILPHRGFIEVWKDTKTGHWYASHSVSQEVQWLGDDRFAWMVSHDAHDFGAAVSVYQDEGGAAFEQSMDFMELFEVAVFTSASGMHFLEYEEGGTLIPVASLASQYQLATATLVDVGDVHSNLAFGCGKAQKATERWLHCGVVSACIGKRFLLFAIVCCPYV